MGNIVTWIHHLLNPHCVDCLEEKLGSKICASCETLKQQLQQANYEKQLLLNRILSPNNPEPVEIEQEPIELKQSKYVPWSVMRQTLEENDRAKAIEIAKQKAEREKLQKEIEQIEKEVGVK